MPGTLWKTKIDYAVLVLIVVLRVRSDADLCAKFKNSMLFLLSEEME